MLLPNWILLMSCLAFGLVGLWIANKRGWMGIPWALLLVVFGAAGMAGVTHEISLDPRYRREVEDWTSIAVLFWSVVAGLSLPFVGLYLRDRQQPRQK